MAQSESMRVLVLGATGTAGQGAVRALCAAGHDVVCLVRPGSDADLPGRAERRFADVTRAQDLRASGFRDERFDAVVSCLASRSGTPADAWAIDHDAHVSALQIAQDLGVQRFVYLSAICVQRPLLAFQHAKLAFEAKLRASGLTYSIVRPTAFFKSLSGQMARVQAGKPFLVFGDGRLTACTPISDDDLGRYIARCLTDPDLQNQILPIGGPGPALTPLDQVALVEAALGRSVRVKHVPVGLIDTIARGLDLVGRIIPAMRAKAELARIGRYYATESMLVLDPDTGTYDRAATPSFGHDTLADHYARLARGDMTTELREHAVF